MKTYKVEVLPYRSEWSNYFHDEANHIQTALGHGIKEIYHIGSTAIPNMPAKPIIDMMLVCDNIDDVNELADKLQTLGYPAPRRQIIPHHSFFTRKQSNEMTFHLHIHERGSPQINRHVNFRDYLSQHRDDANAYAELKIHLAKQYPNDISQYILGKDKLVQEIDAKAKLWSKRKKDYLTANTGNIAGLWSKEKLVKAMIANLNVSMTHFAQYLNHVELIRVPGFTLVNSELKSHTFNYVIDANFSSAEASQKIQDITHYFSQHHTPFSWWVAPYDKPDDLAEQLQQYGYRNTKNNIAMYLDLDAWQSATTPIPELKIIRATDEKTLHDFALVLANDTQAFKQYFSWVASILTNDDPIEYYVGYVDGKPVVRGLICCFGQVAGLHGLSTSPLERNKGYGTAMQQFRLQRAKELGYHIAVLQASNSGHSLYKKLGYKECGKFREFKL